MSVVAWGCFNLHAKPTVCSHNYAGVVIQYLFLATLVAWLYGWLYRLVHYFGPQWNTIRRIAKKFGYDIHVPLRINCDKFGKNILT